MIELKIKYTNVENAKLLKKLQKFIAIICVILQKICLLNSEFKDLLKMVIRINTLIYIHLLSNLIAIRWNNHVWKLFLFIEFRNLHEFKVSSVKQQGYYVLFYVFYMTLSFRLYWNNFMVLETLNL